MAKVAEAVEKETEADFSSIDVEMDDKAIAIQTPLLEDNILRVIQLPKTD